MSSTLDNLSSNGQLGAETGIMSVIVHGKNIPLKTAYSTAMKDQDFIEFAEKKILEQE